MDFAVEFLVAPLDGPALRRREEATTVQLGRAPQCQIAFPGRAHDMVSGRHAQLEWDGRQLRVRDLGSSNGTFVNERKITGPTPLVAGDWIRLGQTGPGVQIGRVEVIAPYAGEAAGGWQPTGNEAFGAPSAGDRAPRPSREAGQPSSQRTALVMSGVALAATLLIAVLVLISLRQSNAPAVDEREAAASAQPVGTPANEPLPPPAAGDAPRVAGQTPAEVEAPPAEPLGWERAKAGVRLLVAEHPEGLLASAMGTGFVISKQALLTTAVTAIDLGVLQQQGWKLWCVDPHSRQRTAVEALRVHAGFEQSADNPAARVYYDLAQVTLASPAETEIEPPDQPGTVESGQPVYCVGLDGDVGSRITKFDRREVQGWPGQVFAITSLAETPGAPRLLHLEGKWNVQQAGAVVVDDQGRPVGVYAVSSSPEAPLALHYGPLLDRATLTPEPLDRPSGLWVAPTLPQAGSPPDGR